MSVGETTMAQKTHAEAKAKGGEEHVEERRNEPELAPGFARGGGGVKASDITPFQRRE